MFIENPNDAKKLISLLNNQTSIVNLYYTKPNIHSGKNIPLVMMVFVNQTYYVVSFNHPDAINIPIEFLNLVYETNGKKLIFDRKKLKYHVPKFKNCVDATICSYLSLKSELDGNYIDSRVKDFRSVPIMILFKHFKNLCQSVGDTEYESNLTKYEQDFSNALFGIEKNGLYVTDFNLGDSNLVDNNNLVFSQYNMMTPTGRPSNAFGNVNFDCFE